MSQSFDMIRNPVDPPAEMKKNLRAPEFLGPLLLARLLEPSLTTPSAVLSGS